jgi:acyl-homoserine-lactone acylase
MKNHRGFLAWMARVTLMLGLVSLAFVAVPAVAGVPAKGTEILWDRYGIPHIFAPDHPSLFYAYGYAQMEAHAELLLRLYAQARGRGAEFYGDRRTRATRSSESYLESDRWVRTNGIPERAKVWASEQSPEFAPLLRAFVAGLNAWGAGHADSLSGPAKAVLPVAVEDVLAHGLRVIHYDWIVSQARMEIRLKSGNEEVHGSNAWAIAPARSASGHALLLSN